MLLVSFQFTMQIQQLQHWPCFIIMPTWGMWQDCLPSLSNWVGGKLWCSRGIISMILSLLAQSQFFNNFCSGYLCKYRLLWTHCHHCKSIAGCCYHFLSKKSILGFNISMTWCLLWEPSLSVAGRMHHWRSWDMPTNVGERVWKWWQWCCRWHSFLLLQSSSVVTEDIG